MVLRTLVDAGKKETYGLAITRSTNLASGTVFPILHRLEAAGWISLRDETLHEKRQRPASIPARRYIKLTPQGKKAALDILRNRGF